MKNIKLLLIGLAAAFALTGCGDEAIRKKLLKQQTVLAGIFSVVLVLVAAFGGFSMMKG